MIIPKIKFTDLFSFNGRFIFVVLFTISISASSVAFAFDIRSNDIVPDSALISNSDTLKGIIPGLDTSTALSYSDSVVEASNQIDSLQVKNAPDTIPASLSSDPDSLEDKIIVGKKIHTPDIVFLKNGDRITGKILSFEQGRLCIDGQGPGIVYIKWHKISTIKGGDRDFKVEDVNGVLYIGRLDYSPDTGEVIIQDNIKYGVFLSNVVRIFPLESEWYRGFKGDIGAGMSYTKSSEVMQINTNYDLYYVIKKWRIKNDLSFISTSTNKEPASIRIQTNLQSLYKLHKKWLLSEIVSFNRNDELGIDSRISVGLGGGNSIVQTERQRFLFLTGIIQNWEKVLESNRAAGNLEWPFTIQHTIYSFVKPNLTSSTSITSFVGITEKGRYRVDATTDLTWEFIANVKLKLSFYYNYDNKLVEGKISKQDYGTTLSLEVKLK